ncbi:Crp/Fnr family transcriptional regulator [Fonticella tunisiensis]|uniref:CRP-like cAMP-binding protein n=1 Tax=Fonticella tunisiensis TaxID=1096341 RepID=A0A4R7KTT4_9CLOT|nr:Crp/Fnr family transcriptional regulator [Fonticella tunisiensis]TDT61308.1 CRP-like cAMP-binding protein [Fonticella tunisiensis]
MFEKWLKKLSSCILFKEMSADDINAIFHCMNPKVKCYRKNDNIVISGEKLEEIGIILFGQATVFKENAAGDRVIMSVIGPGEMFGEIAAFSGIGVWPATVMAQGQCEVMFIPHEKIAKRCETSCASHSILISNMLSIISEKAYMLNRKVEYLTIRSIRGKISAYFLEQYKKAGTAVIRMPLNRNELADFLNVSRPSLSREMCRMRDEGIIEFHRESVKIKDIEALKRIVR